jgi:hypothetical protein
MMLNRVRFYLIITQYYETLTVSLLGQKAFQPWVGLPPFSVPD